MQLQSTLIISIFSSRNKAYSSDILTTTAVLSIPTFVSGELSYTALSRQVSTQNRYLISHISNRIQGL